ncbi:uncharacterized protein VSU04_010772 [Chlamydotis macqueenii]
MLKIAPRGDSTALAMWEVIFSLPETLENVLKELFIQLQDPQNTFFCTYSDQTSLLSLALLASRNLEDEVFEPMYKVERFLRSSNAGMLSLVLTGLVTLSERADMARKMQVLLPDMTEVLQGGNKDIKRKALVVFQNVMGRLRKEEASPIAVQLVEKLLPLFDHEFSQLRELSISLFGNLMKAVVGKNKSQVKVPVRMGLLPLFFHMSDQVQSVAKVQISKLSRDAGKRPPDV